MEHGSIIGSVCYEKITDAGDKEHVPIGKLIFFRNHQGGAPSCQFRWDVVPGVAWRKDEEVWFIANFIPSEKIPEPPYLCGKIYTTTNEKGDHVEVGHINSRDDKVDPKTGECFTQYFMQFFGVPIGEVLRQQRRGLMKAMEMELSIIKGFENEAWTVETAMENLNKLFDAKAKSIFCKVEVQ